jgi:hypothetical protein
MTGFFVRVYRKPLDFQVHSGRSGDAGCKVPVYVEVERLSIEELQQFFSRMEHRAVVNWACRLARWIGDNVQHEAGASDPLFSGLAESREGGGDNGAGEEQ